MEEELKAFGLNEKQVRVYLAVLELGSSSATIIAQRSKVHRTLAYEILDSLVGQGLVSHVIKGKKKYFEAASPETFLKILEEREQKIRKILPQLAAIKKTVQKKPSITLYEGVEGIKTVFEDLLTESKSFVALSPRIAMENVLKFYFPHLIERREQAGIHARLLSDAKPLATKMIDYKLVPMNYETGVWVYNNKVMIPSFPKRNPLAIVIENEDIAKAVKHLFEMAWESTPKKR